MTMKLLRLHNGGVQHVSRLSQENTRSSTSVFNSLAVQQLQCSTCNIVGQRGYDDPIAAHTQDTI